MLIKVKTCLLVLPFFAISLMSQGLAAASKKLLIINAQKEEPYKTSGTSLLKALADMKYAEGSNLEVTQVSIENKQDEGEKQIKEALPKKYDVILLQGTVAAKSAKAVVDAGTPHANEQAFIYTAVTDPVGVGLVDNFKDAPKANFSGVSYPVPVKSRFDFIKKVMPKARVIGLIHVDMPQSISYKRWVEDLLQEAGFKGYFTVEFRSVPLITGDDASKKMAEAAKAHVLELNDKVDLFLSPNDQMGVSLDYPKTVTEVMKKPLIGLTEKEIMENAGSVMSIYPSSAQAGKQAARMIKGLFDGKTIKEFKPEWPKENGFAFNLTRAALWDAKKNPEIGNSAISIPADMIAAAGDKVVK